MADRNTREYVLKRFEALKTERSSFDSHWKELSEFVQPRRGRFFTTDRNKGDRRYSKIINSRATQALRIARSGLLAGLMSPARPWFLLEHPDPDMMEYQPVKVWLNLAERAMRAIFNSSNLYTMAPVTLGELLLFGTSALQHDDDFDNVARFYAHTVGSYVIAQNDKQEVDTFAREFEMTAEQIIGKFANPDGSIPTTISESVRSAYDNGHYDSWFPVIHVVEPNPDYKPGVRRSTLKRYRSLYLEPTAGNRDDNTFLRRSGYDEFPVYVPRWDLTNEDIYGTDCPGMTALGDVKGLQIEERRKAQGIDKMVNPPLGAPPSARNVPIASLPGGVSIYQADGNQKIEPLYQVQLRVNELSQDIMQVERRINEAFFVDLFKPMQTIEGIQPRNELFLSSVNQEALLQLGPTLERLHGEFLSRLVDRTFAQMMRANILPPAPKELTEAELKVEYISTLAMAQRAVAAGSIERVTGFVGGLLKTGFTDAADKFDAMQVIDEYAHALGAPPKIIRPDDVVQKVQEERKQQEQAAQAAQMAQSMANTAKMAADAKMEDDSVLTRAAANMGGRR